MGRVNGRYFVNVVGVGFDAAVAEMVSGKYKNIKGYLAYVIAFFEKLTDFKKFNIVTSCDNQVFNHEDTLVALVANGSFYGGHFCIAPQALINDGNLDLTVISYENIPVTTYLAVRALIKKHVTMNEVSLAQGKEILIEGDISVPVHVDGEVTCSLPLRVEVLPGALRILMPKKRR